MLALACPLVGKALYIKARPGGALHTQVLRAILALSPPACMLWRTLASLPFRVQPSTLRGLCPIPPAAQVCPMRLILRTSSAHKGLLRHRGWHVFNLQQKTFSSRRQASARLWPHRKGLPLYINKMPCYVQQETKKPPLWIS